MKAESYKILALDPGEKFGWAVTSTIFGCWNFKLKRDESFGMKLLRFRSKLIEVVKDNEIELIVYERPSGRNSNGLISHSKFVGIIEEFGIQEDIPTRGYSATEIKKFATGNGIASKDLMRKFAIKKFRYTGKDDNEVDALWILELAKKDLML